MRSGTKMIRRGLGTVGWGYSKAWRKSQTDQVSMGYQGLQIRLRALQLHGYLGIHGALTAKRTSVLHHLRRHRNVATLEVDPGKVSQWKPCKMFCTRRGACMSVAASRTNRSISRRLRCTTSMFLPPSGREDYRGRALEAGGSGRWTVIRLSYSCMPLLER